MIKQILLFCATTLISLHHFGQQGLGGFPIGWKSLDNYKQLPCVTFEKPNIEALQAEDELNEKTGTGPWRFGYKHQTNLNLENAGTWKDLPNGGKVWQLLVRCTDAQTINFQLKDVHIPERNELYFYNPSKSFILGKFTSNHLYQGELGTELIPGSEAIVEYYVHPTNNPKEASLNIYSVVHGYRSSEDFAQKIFGQAGSCNMNVNCPDAAGWTNQRNSVVMLVTSGDGFCTGALINNVNNDGKPYVLTANHCYSTSIASWVFRFNWQGPDCTNPANSPSFESLSGAVLRARRTPSDMMLLEITGGLENNTVPASFNAYFSGWDHSGSIPSSAVCIHHPRGDIKKISFDDDPLDISQGMSSTEPNSTWTVVWDRNTTTQPASSGSPLFNESRRIIGQLWGGSASCTNLTGADYYGRLANSWEPVGSDSTNQLKAWLDPNNTGAVIIDGFNPNGPVLALDASLANPQGVLGTICGSEVNPKFTLVNLGSTILTEAVINYGFDGTTDLVYNWTGSLAQYQSEVISLPTANLSSGNYNFQAMITSVNTSTDENAINNTINGTFEVITDGSFVTLNLQLDCSGDEITWELTNDAGTTVFYSGGPYTQSVNPILINRNLCLTNACYKFKIMDSYGDGLLKAGWCPSSGYYTLTDENNTVLAQLDVANANFGSSRTDSFCLDYVAALNESTISWSIFPNPTSDKLHVRCEVAGLKQLEISSISGTLVHVLETESNFITLHTQDFAKGMYLIKIQTKEGLSIKNFIVE